MNRILALALTLTAGTAHAARLKELVDVEGFRPNHLVGLGLVVGLAGTGDDASSVATRRPLAAMLKHLGTLIDPNDLKSKNVAVVTVTAELPPFARPGMPLDVTVSSMGNAKSLAGGTLVETQLRGVDGGTYALAQGSLTLGGFAVEGGSGSTQRKNHVTAGHIPGGGVVEREAPGGLPSEQVTLLLREPDFTTAARIAAAINATFGHGSRVRDPGSVVVDVAGSWRGRTVELVARLESIEAEPDAPGRVIIDERTGTIVVGLNVTLRAAAIAHGGINIKVQERREVSQPAPLSPGGQTVTTPASEVEVEEKGGQLAPIAGAATVGEVAAALNALGVKPRDLVPIFQALKAAGALHAEIQVL
jgi:flagellar P-ring protein precursor FlgI